MAAGKIMTGARAKLQIYDANTGLFKPIGIYSNVEYSVQYGAEPAFILGRVSAAAIDYTFQDIVHVTATGWRVVNHSWWADGHFPTLDKVLKSDYLSMVIMDYVTGAKLLQVEQLRALSASGAMSPKLLSSVSMHYVGITISDETAQNNVESAQSMSLPQ